MATNHISGQCSAEDVFAVLANGWLYPVWVVGASRMRAVDAAWPQPTARLHHSFGVWPAVINDVTECLEWDPPRRAVFRAHGWPMGAARVTIEVTDRPNGCGISITEDAEAGPGTLVPKPVRDVMIKVRNMETLNRLRLMAEGHAP